MKLSLIVKLKKKSKSSCFKGNEHDFETSIENIMLHIHKKLIVGDF